MTYPQKIDLHMHTTISDGTDTPEEILACVKKAGLELFAVTDHDAIKGGIILRQILQEGDPQFVTGTEFSCRDEEGQYHILGYGYDPESAPVRDLVEKGHRIRMGKVQIRLDYLRSEYSFAFPEEEIRKLLSLDNPGKPHIANLMVKYGYAKTKEEAMTEYLNKLRIRLAFLGPEETIAGILAGGGIPVLAHPTYGNGDQLILGEDMDRRLRRLIGYGLQGVEAFYSGFSRKISAEVLGFADRYDLYITAGSDYHGRNKMITPGDTGLEDWPVYPKGLCRFLDAISG